MKVSYNWLQEYIEETLPAPETVAEKIIFHAFEVESLDKLGTGQEEDWIFDIKILPDRAGDCLSHCGIARELAGLLNLTFKQKEFSPLPDATLTLPLEIKSDLCRRYIAVQIDGIAVGKSPAWLVERLESVGQKSINNIVDAANFVMLDMGQPIHVFNRAEIDGGIIVRDAHENETIKLIGGEEKTLSPNDLVIADYIGALAIAGVKGGAEAEVTTETTSIVIEVANFDATAVRKTSRRLTTVTDASKRFENNFSPEWAHRAAAQVTAMILEHAGGTVVGVRDEYKEKISPRTITCSTSDIVRVLGPTITTTTIEEVFRSYRYQFTRTEDTFALDVPFWRADIVGAHDIAEEIGRYVGYDTIPPAPLPFEKSIEKNDTDEKITAVKWWCASQEFREVCTYTFRNSGEVSVIAGAKGKEKLRAHLSDGLKESFELNRLNAPLLGLTEVKLFEVGTVFFKDKESIYVAICDKGTIQELDLDEFIKEKHIDVSATPSFIPRLPSSPFVMWSLYPFITRDLAVWVSTPEKRSLLENMVREFSEKHCASPATLFDEFTKGDRTSVAYRFIFQASDRTLTDEEVAKTFQALLDTISAETAFEIR